MAKESPGRRCCRGVLRARRGCVGSLRWATGPPPPVWSCTVSGWVNTARSGERLGLEGLVLRLRDGSGIEQLLGACDLLGRALGSAGNLLDVPLLLGLLLRNRRPLALGHAPAPRNEVDQCAQPRHEDEQDRP